MLIAFFGNDFYDNVGRILEGALHAEVQGGEIHVVWPDASNAQGDLISKLKDWSYLINLVAYCADRYHDRRVCEKMIGRPQTPAAGRAHRLPGTFPITVPKVLVTRHYLAKFKKACDEQEARLVVAYVPGQAELGEDDCSVTEDLTPPEQATYRKAFFHCADVLGIETVDLLPRLLAAKKAGRFDRVTFRHDFHWNENGHAVAAETIAACLLHAIAPTARKRRGEQASLASSDRFLDHVTVHTLAGDWSIFRRTDVFCEQAGGRKHGPVPFPQRKGDSPIFAAINPVCRATSAVPRKSGQSPATGHLDHRAITRQSGSPTARCSGRRNQNCC